MKFILRVAVIAALVMPSFAFAQSNSDIVSQIQALLNQVTQMQQQIGVSTNTSGSTNGAPCGPSSAPGCGSGAAANTAACPQSGIMMKKGSSGESVTKLQQFLVVQSAHPSSQVSGYYGALTEASVQRWQTAHGIVSSGSPSSNGFGVVGPRTLAAMIAACGGGADVGGGGSNDAVVAGFIKVSPVTGIVPLVVNVETTINTAKSCLAANYVLSWGDNSAPINIALPANKCDILAQTYTHTYIAGGSYTVTLAAGEHKTTATVNVSGATGTAPADGTAGALVNGELNITINPSSFTPSNVTIPSGTKVTWTNKDTFIHTVTADNSSFNSGGIDNGQTFSLTFTKKGEYTYYCAYHGGPGGIGMSGKIVVQ